MDFTTMSARELKAFIVDRGGIHKDCFEKSELRARAAEFEGKDLIAAASGGGGGASASAAAPPPSSSSSSSSAAPPSGGPPQYVTTTEVIEGYTCTVVAPKAGPVQGAVIFLHGFGATSADFKGLAEMLGPQMTRRMKWVLPQAHPSPTQGVSAWWEINVQEWMMGMSNPAALAQLIRKVPPGLPEARAKLLRLVDHVVATTDGIDYNGVNLGGFSQGAMTATDLALSMPEDKKVGAVLSISGAPIVVEEWAQKATSRKGIKVLVSHGRSDMVLPFASSQWLIDLLKAGGMEVRVKHHDGGHELGTGVLEEMLKLLEGI